MLYEVTGAPPLLVGGFHVRWLCPGGLVAVTVVGGPGGLAVVEALGVADVSLEGALGPTALVATTT
jgi:hypothetical protein